MDVDHVGPLIVGPGLASSGASRDTAGLSKRAMPTGNPCAGWPRLSDVAL